MAKFSGNPTPAQVFGAVKTKTETPDTLTYNLAPAYSRDAKSELFLLAVTNMVGEGTYYEKAGTRDNRFIQLVHQVAAEDPDWLRRFIPWLRDEANMRSASVVAAAEYVKAGGEAGRQLVKSALVRADEPMELLAYWYTNYGKKIPKSLKRGAADAALKLFNEYAALKYDSQGHAWRMGDVIDLTHPKADAEWQSALFKYLLDRRHNREIEISDLLPMIAARRRLEVTPADQRRALIDSENWNEIAKSAGITWEWLSSWIPGGMDAKAWEAVIPQMGYMALLRNLRNFDEAKIGTKATNYVQQYLVTPENVARSRQFTYRFWSAYKNCPSVRWASALEQALELSTQNIPEFKGSTIVFTDTSGSMASPVSGNSNIQLHEIAVVFASALAKRCDGRAKLISFADRSEELLCRPDLSVLRAVEYAVGRNGRVGHGTNLGTAIKQWYKGEDRVAIFSDLQTSDLVPKLNVPVYVFNVGGYKATPFKTGKNGVYEIGGFTDKAFTMINMIESRRDGGWPF